MSGRYRAVGVSKWRRLPFVVGEYRRSDLLLVLAVLTTPGGTFDDVRHVILTPCAARIGLHLGVIKAEET